MLAKLLLDAQDRDIALFQNYIGRLANVPGTRAMIGDLEGRIKAAELCKAIIRAHCAGL